MTVRTKYIVGIVIALLLMFSLTLIVGAIGPIHTDGEVGPVETVKVP